MQNYFKFLLVCLLTWTSQIYAASTRIEVAGVETDPFSKSLVEKSGQKNQTSKVGILDRIYSNSYTFWPLLTGTGVATLCLNAGDSIRRNRPHDARAHVSLAMYSFGIGMIPSLFLAVYHVGERFVETCFNFES